MKEFKIKIDNKIIVVTEEIYITYYKMGRRERYIDEISRKNNLSYNRLQEQDYPVEEKMFEPRRCVEDIVIQKIILEKMISALDTLTNYERMIIDELFINGKSIRDLSEYLAVPRSTLHEQKEKIIKKLRKIINNE